MSSSSYDSQYPAFTGRWLTPEDSDLSEVLEEVKSTLIAIWADTGHDMEYYAPRLSQAVDDFATYKQQESAIQILVLRSAETSQDSSAPIIGVNIMSDLEEEWDNLPPQERIGLNWHGTAQAFAGRGVGHILVKSAATYAHDTRGLPLRVTVMQGPTEPPGAKERLVEYWTVKQGFAPAGTDSGDNPLFELRCPEHLRCPVEDEDEATSGIDQEYEEEAEGSDGSAAGSWASGSSDLQRPPPSSPPPGW